MQEKYQENFMTEKITLDKLQKNLEFFKQMYDEIRLVNPIQKRVMEYNNEKLGEKEEVCYGYWGNGHICDNCISVRAHYEQKSFIKLEHTPDTVMLVTALPIENSQPPIVLELLKDATDTMMIGSGEYNQGQLLHTVVQNINDMVVKDELTSMFNRRFLDERLPVDIISATMHERPLSLIFIDIDNMKTVNDQLGHTAGDEALRYAASTILNILTDKNDWAARYGGDEFIICLNNTDHEKANQISQELYHNFETTKVLIENSNVSINISMGVVTMMDMPYTAEELIKLADERMYAAKRGRKETDAGNR